MAFVLFEFFLSGKRNFLGDINFGAVEWGILESLHSWSFICHFCLIHCSLASPNYNLVPYLILPQGNPSCFAA